jgi:hypothetical protein
MKTEALQLFPWVWNWEELQEGNPAMEPEMHKEGPLWAWGRHGKMASARAFGYQHPDFWVQCWPLWASPHH